jgi:TonB family protein
MAGYSRLSHQPGDSPGDSNIPSVSADEVLQRPVRSGNMRPMLRQALFFALNAVALSSHTVGQSSNSPQPVPAREAIAHIVKHFDPATPPQAGQICGEVTVSMTISPAGDVSASELIRGHPFLARAAVTAVKWWKYKPFETNGVSIPVTTQASVVFPCSGRQIMEQEKFYPQARKCRDLIEHTNYVEAERECRQADKISDGLPAGLISERSGAKTLLATALLMQRRFAEAIPLYQEALELDTRYLDANDGSLASDYWRLGEAQFAARQLAKTDELYGNAISTLQAAILKWPVMKEDYTRRLKTYLERYAQLKEAEGQADAAKQLRTEAHGLQP